MTHKIADDIKRMVELEIIDTGGIGGTLAGNALSLASMRATLSEVLTQKNFDHMSQLGTRWSDGVDAAIGEKVSFFGAGPAVGVVIHFQDDQITPGQEFALLHQILFPVQNCPLPNKDWLFVGLHGSGGGGAILGDRPHSGNAI